MGAKPPPQVPSHGIVIRPDLVRVLVPAVAQLVLYVAASSVLGLLTPLLIGLPAFIVWGNISADLVFVIGSVLVALVVFNGRRVASSTFRSLFLWVPLGYLLTFAVYSISFKIASGSLSVDQSWTSTWRFALMWGQPGLIFASLAPVVWGRQGEWLSRLPAVWSRLWS